MRNERKEMLKSVILEIIKATRSIGIDDYTAGSIVEAVMQEHEFSQKEVSITVRVQLILARVEILKLKADDHTWQCYVPENVKYQIDKTLMDIDSILGDGVDGMGQ